MRFLVDAQLPRSLSLLLNKEGIDSIHTLDLPEGNRTKDSSINDITVSEQRILITKDRDFVQSYLLSGRPYKLLHVSAGNMRNEQILDLFKKNMAEINEVLRDRSYVEMTGPDLIVHF